MRAERRAKAGGRGPWGPGRLAAWLLLFLALAVPAGAHEVTFSQVDLGLEESRTRIAVQIPNLALLFEEPSPLPEGTTEDSLRAGSFPSELTAALSGLLTERLLLRSGGEALLLRVGSVEPAGDRVVLTATAPPVPGALEGEADLFPEDQLHKVFVNVYRGPDLAGQYALDAGNAAFALAGPERPLGEVIATFVREGIRHIFIGPDHILFVIALILLGGSVWTQAKIVTAFTLAHSITLTLATLELVALPSRLVESTIALSVVVVGLHDLARLRSGVAVRPGRDLRAAFAFAFGLIHGFGFASVLQELDLPREALAWSLAAFNVGVEIGQVAIVLVAAGPLLLLRRHAPPMVARATLGSLAGAVVAVGALWFVQRAFGA